MFISKRVITVLAAVAAVGLAGCSSGGDDVSDHVRTRTLDPHQKAVAAVWWQVADGRERERLAAMSGAEVRDAVGIYAMWCAVSEERMAVALTRGSGGLDGPGAARLAEAIEDHLCEGARTRGKAPSTVASRTAAPAGSAGQQAVPGGQRGGRERSAPRGPAGSRGGAVKVPHRVR